MRAKRSGGRAKIALTESGRRFPDQALTTTRTDAMNRPNKDRNRKHLVRDCSHPLLTDKLPCKAVNRNYTPCASAGLCRSILHPGRGILSIEPL